MSNMDWSLYREPPSPQAIRKQWRDLIIALLLLFVGVPLAGICMAFIQIDLLSCSVKYEWMQWLMGYCY